MFPTALYGLYAHLGLTFAAALLLALPFYLWMERRVRPAWDPVTGGPVEVRRGSYRDTPVRPLGVGRAPGAVRLAMYAALVAQLLALWEEGRALWFGRAQHWFVGVGQPTLAGVLALLLVPTLTLVVALRTTGAARGLLRATPEAWGAARRAARGLFVFALLRVVLALAAANALHFGRAFAATRGLLEGALLAFVAWSLLRAARRVELRDVAALESAVAVDAARA